MTEHLHELLAALLIAVALLAAAASAHAPVTDLPDPSLSPSNAVPFSNTEEP